MLDLSDKLAEINRRNREFWETQRAALAECVDDDNLLAEVLDNVKFHNQGVPINSQKTFESVLERVQKQRSAHRREQLTEFARKGGKTEKPDALQKLILERVPRNPDISEQQLLNELRRQRGNSCIYDIAEDSEGALTIFFTEPDGRLGEAPVSGLKHRLSRAKKKLLSR